MENDLVEMLRSAADQLEKERKSVAELVQAVRCVKSSCSSLEDGRVVVPYRQWVRMSDALVEVIGDEA